MSVRHSLLAILDDAPSHGYGLKTAFEHTTAGAWPLNVGQVYTTLARLERDGFVESVDADDRERQTWRITPAGHRALGDWFDTPVVDDPPARDELALKVLAAVAADTTDVDHVLRRQRVASLERLQQLTRRLRRADPAAELPWVMLLDLLILKAEAEVRWLDRCEARLRERTAP
jgi:DNA-binding PadR family transcriptional regulator